MKKMYLRQDHVLVLNTKSLLLSRVGFLLLVFLPSLIELNNNKKNPNQNYEDHQHSKKKKMSPRVFSSLPSVFWSPDVENLVELRTFLEGGRKFWCYCCRLILSKPDNYLSSWRLKSQTTTPTKPHLLYIVTKQYL